MEVTTCSLTSVCRTRQEHFVKAQLVLKIDTIMRARRLKQVDAAAMFGIRQPNVSKMLRGEFCQFSVERLMRFLVALGQDVEMVVRPHSGTDSSPVLRGWPEKQQHPF